MSAVLGTQRECE